MKYKQLVCPEYPLWLRVFRIICSSVFLSSHPNILKKEPKIIFEKKCPSRTGEMNWWVKYKHEDLSLGPRNPHNCWALMASLLYSWFWGGRGDEGPPPPSNKLSSQISQSLSTEFKWEILPQCIRWSCENLLPHTHICVLLPIPTPAHIWTHICKCKKMNLIDPWTGPGIIVQMCRQITHQLNGMCHSKMNPFPKLYVLCVF